MSAAFRRFNFTDLELALRVRRTMLEVLTKFDANQNRKFEEDQIKAAMVSILGEDEMEVDYVVKNVFRYDRDNDGAVTYSQFTNFSVEQHFGEMAIQRLHRRHYYSNGIRRIMNLEEFSNTLDYCLGFINCKGTHLVYEQLFEQVDLDGDGWISYQDYFIFLREYFGTQSEAFQQEENPKKPEPVAPAPQPSLVDTNTDDPFERLARLIYSQFKIKVMLKDHNKNLLLERTEVDDILGSLFDITYTEQTRLEDDCLNGLTSVQYEGFMKTALVTYLGQILPRKNYPAQGLSETEFISYLTNACKFVPIQPSDSLLKSCFRQASRGSPSLQQSAYTAFIRNVFSSYQFDTRGLPSAKTPAPKHELYSFSSYA